MNQRAVNKEYEKAARFPERPNHSLVSLLHSLVSIFADTIIPSGWR
jgi:hypothetical protein